jgi:hypothetical protein
MLPHHMELWKREGATWRRMLATQRPISPAVLVQFGSNKDNDSDDSDDDDTDIESRTIDCSGTMMGDIFTETNRAIYNGLVNDLGETAADIREEYIYGLTELWDGCELEWLIARSKKWAKERRARVALEVWEMEDSEGSAE